MYACLLYVHHFDTKLSLNITELFSLNWNNKQFVFILFLLVNMVCLL